jgi:hypothetical protein
MDEKLNRIGSNVAPLSGRASFVQTELEVHEAWGHLTAGGPQYARAASLLHLMVARMDKQSAIVASREVLAEFAGCSVSTIKRSLKILQEANWIEIVSIGKGGTNAYLINSRVAWRAERKLLPTAAFTATVIASSRDQEPEVLAFEEKDRPLLRRIPTIYSNERQLPTGNREIPPVQRGLPGIENDPPALLIPEHVDQETGEIYDRLRNI